MPGLETTIEEGDEHMDVEQYPPGSYIQYSGMNWESYNIHTSQLMPIYPRNEMTRKDYFTNFGRDSCYSTLEVWSSLPKIHASVMLPFSKKFCMIETAVNFHPWFPHSIYDTKASFSCFCCCNACSVYSLCLI